MTITRRGLFDETELLDNEIAEKQRAKADAFDAYREQLKAAGFAPAAVKDEIAAFKQAKRKLRALQKNADAVMATDALVDEIVAEVRSGTQNAIAHSRPRDPNPPPERLTLTGSGEPASVPHAGAGSSQFDNLDIPECLRRPVLQ